MNKQYNQWLSPSYWPLTPSMNLTQWSHSKTMLQRYQELNTGHILHALTEIWAIKNVLCRTLTWWKCLSTNHWSLAPPRDLTQGLKQLTSKFMVQKYSWTKYKKYLVSGYKHMSNLLMQSGQTSDKWMEGWTYIQMEEITKTISPLDRLCMLRT